MKFYWRMVVFLIFIMALAVSLSAQTNILPNPGFEIREPNYWATMNDGMSGAECIWATDTFMTGGEYSFKIYKPSATTEAVGWESENNADLYWNNAASGTYTLSFYAKTEGVNTDPANDDARIGVWYRYYSGETLLAEKFVAVDQSTASTNWTQVQDALLVSGEPDGVMLEVVMGKDATGMVWFDNVDCWTDPWSMGVFNGNAETPEGWMNWTDGAGGYANVVADTVYDGDYSVLMWEQDENGDEMVFYSEPVPAKPDKWYMFTVYMKTEGINTDTSWYATNVTGERADYRAGAMFMFHVGPDITKNFDTVGGDQFWYLDQRPGQENADWLRYTVVSKAPPEAAGVSVRARFNPYPTGNVWYDDFSVQQVDMVIVSNIDEPTNRLAITPAEFELFNNYPNPFNPETIIEYKVPKSGNVKLAIYNILGQNVKTLVDAHQIAGTYNVMWDGTDNSGQKLASGVYFYQLIGENALITKKMTLLK